MQVVQLNLYDIFITLSIYIGYTNSDFQGHRAFPNGWLVGLGPGAAGGLPQVDSLVLLPIINKRFKKQCVFSFVTQSDDGNGQFICLSTSFLVFNCILFFVAFLCARVNSESMVFGICAVHFKKSGAYGYPYSSYCSATLTADTATMTAVVASPAAATAAPAPPTNSIQLDNFLDQQQTSLPVSQLS